MPKASNSINIFATCT